MEKVKLLHAIINTAIDGIITIDYRGIIESMNPASLKISAMMRLECMEEISRC